MNLLGGSTKVLVTTLRNAGTVTWTGGSLDVDYSSADNSYGLIQNLPGAVWDIQSGQFLFNRYPNGAYFQNAGTLQGRAAPARSRSRFLS